MKKIFLFLFIFSSIASVPAQTELLVLAKNGLNIRSNPDPSSQKIGKFNYAEKVAILEKTNTFFEIKDNGKTIQGEWYKVRGKSDVNDTITGYVFSGFLTKPIQKDTFEFINYNDDYDYFYLTAKKGDTIYRFINPEDGRSYLKGDTIEIEWKEDIISNPGDEEVKEFYYRIISTKRL